MDKQNAILKTHELEVEFELEVIGQGSMIDTPRQIGEWWVMPADHYDGTIPPDIQKKWDDFKALDIPVLGYLIAEDMRLVRIKREKEAKQKQDQVQARLKAQQEELKAIAKQQKAREAEMRQVELERQREADQWRRQQAAHDAGDTLMAVVKGVATVAGVVGMGLVGFVGLILQASFAAIALAFCPILIAVLPDGRWVCLGAWWD